MQVYKLPIFDSWIDGNMSLAQRIVKVFNNSDNFRLTNYDGKDEFYNEYISKYDEYVEILKKLVDNDDYFYVLDNVKQALNYFADKGLLNFSHLLGAYIQVLIYIDTAKGIHELDNTHKIISRTAINSYREPIYLNYTVDDIINVLNNFHISHPRIIPFTSQTGAFGMNTFLYLYFNKIYPVACSPNPYPVHHGNYKGSIAVMGHDFTHLPALRLLNATSNDDPSIIDIYGDGYRQEEEYSYYFQDLKKLYIDIMTSNKFSDGQLKGFIMVLFNLIHEYGIVLDCGKFNYKGEVDDLYLLIKNDYYGPYNYYPKEDADIIIDFVKNENIENIKLAYTYRLNVSGQMYKDLCEHYKLFFRNQQNYDKYDVLFS